jgi:hypothetical protein
VECVKGCQNSHNEVGILDMLGYQARQQRRKERRRASRLSGDPARLERRTNLRATARMWTSCGNDSRMKLVDRPVSLPALTACLSVVAILINSSGIGCLDAVPANDSMNHSREVKIESPRLSETIDSGVRIRSPR